MLEQLLEQCCTNHTHIFFSLTSFFPLLRSKWLAKGRLTPQPVRPIASVSRREPNAPST